MTTVRETIRERIESHERGSAAQDLCIYEAWVDGELLPADEVDARIAEAVAARDEKWAAWHDEKSRAAKERERYFSDGPGWRTHVLGAHGASRAAERFAQLAEWHRGCAAAIRGGNHDG